MYVRLNNQKQKDSKEKKSILAHNYSNQNFQRHDKFTLIGKQSRSIILIIFMINSYKRKDLPNISEKLLDTESEKIDSK